MPSKSEAQRRAMQSAAHGKSALGIPKRVGKKYAAADRRSGKRKLPYKKKNR